MGSVESRIRARLSPQQELRTPSRGRPFRISEIGPDGIVLLLGANEARATFEWSAVEGVVDFLKPRGWVEIAGRYDVSATPETLDSYFKGFVNRATAGWMAVVLEEAGVIEIDRSRPARVRLKEGA